MAPSSKPPWKASIMTPARRALLEEMAAKATPIKVSLTLRPTT